MAKFTGTVRRNDLEGGFWELRTKDGESYQLRTKDNGLLVDGQEVSVEGSVDEGAMGIGMSGAYLDVESWSKA